MRDILFKEMKLSASPLTYLFILFGLMFFLPGYPVLCGAFFVCLGIYQGFLNAREANDTVFSALLPIAKRDVVKGKYWFVGLIEACALLLMTMITILRQTVLCGAAAYQTNALMNANLFTLGVAFLIFGLFNAIFVGGFYRTAYKLGIPFLTFIIVCFVVIGMAEAAHYVPALAVLNAFGFADVFPQVVALIGGSMAYVILTVSSCRAACKRFEKIDL